MRSSGKKYQNVSDSPAAVGLGIKLTFDKARFQMFQDNQKLMKTKVDNSNNQLTSIFGGLQTISQIVSQSESGAADFASLEQKAKAISDQVLSWADGADVFATHDAP